MIDLTIKELSLVFGGQNTTNEPYEPNIKAYDISSGLTAGYSLVRGVPALPAVATGLAISVITDAILSI
ncbi:hypothetical protein [Avibacterium sp. 20-129]|uniref:hypothetical protein n=1 Tax=Avibacterium sp. 20-129 TaxID=2911525 RepID=UPI002246DBE0|nr:hypothetical protein [Avibacterium sp. 20-129]MCW9699214.1 hypothetical protein [Avibacterium sp. 20-129]